MRPGESGGGAAAAAGRGGAGARRQPLTCPGSSHFQASGGARSTCRRCARAGSRAGGMGC